MSNFQLCLITPSYRPDFARCRLLAESIDRLVSPKIHHYLIVDNRDFILFKQLESKNRTVITVESILPWWIQKLPLIENGWFSWKTLPLRNWLVQQIVKLEIANHISEDILIFVDSDVVFIKPFAGREFIKNERARLMRVSLCVEDLSNLDTQIEWYKSAMSLLGISSLTEQLCDRENIDVYVGNLITWKRDNVLRLHQHIEKVTQKSWIKAIASCWNFSEYTLYGIFVDYILKEQAGHYKDDSAISLDYWETKRLNNEQLEQFFQDVSPEYLTVMISAKSQTPVADYSPFICKIQSNQA